MVAAAQSLVAEDYVGHLCGCWLELLLLIPQVFELECRARSSEEDLSTTFPSADDFVIFSGLCCQIIAFSPQISLEIEVKLAGLIYQKAILVYLLTALNTLSNTDPGSHADLIRNAVMEAISMLRELSPTARINTSLCWPIAVIGVMVSEEDYQSMPRDRLIVMSKIIGLDNIQATLTLLDEMWASPTKMRSPWTICKIMQESHILFPMA